MEEWRVIEPAPNYEVSNEWRVRNRKTARILKYNHMYYRPRVLLMVDGERWSVPVEKLIEIAFGPEALVEEEEWQTIREARAYEISNLGRVRNKHTQRILKPYPNNRTGRPQVTLMDAGVRLTRQIHTLMEDTFGP
ncbi:MAG: NUMOD4 domain-containing protein [Bryobacteraceae bacterium]|jgi:hypothetical protein